MEKITHWALMALVIVITVSPVYTQEVSTPQITKSGVHVMQEYRPERPELLPEHTPRVGGCPGIAIACGTTTTGITTIGEGNTTNDWDCYTFSTPGEDLIFRVVYSNPGPGEIAITLSNIVDNDRYLEILYLGASCGTGTCVNNAQYDDFFGQFSNGTNTIEFGVPGAGTYYFGLDSQGDGITSVDISIDCQSTGINANPGCNASDFDADGLITTWNGAPEPIVFDASAGGTVTVCHTFYIQNAGWEWLKYIDVELGTCWMNPRSLSPNGGNSGMNSRCTSGPPPRRGRWFGSIPGTLDTVSWLYAPPSCMNPLWGDGNLLGGGYSCAEYTFCYTADIDPTCVDINGFQDKVIAIDDAIGGLGSTGPSTEFFGADAINSVALPLEWLSFEGEANGFAVRLDWMTANEVMNHHFIVEHAGEGENFTPVDTLTAQASASDLKRYDLMFRENKSGWVKYRVCQVDMNGALTFSKVIELFVGDGSTVKILNTYPNPVKGQITIELFNKEDAEGQLRIFDNRGVEVDVQSISLKSGTNPIVSDVARLPNGLYLFRLESSTGQVWGKFVKQ